MRAAALNENAFLLDPHFSRALLTIAELMDGLRSLRMHDLLPSERGSSLPEVADAQRHHLLALAERLDSFRAAVGIALTIPRLPRSPR